MRRALIDGDILVMKAACVAQEDVNFAPPGEPADWATDVNPQLADQCVRNSIAGIKTATEARKLAIALGPERESDGRRRYWRHNVLPTYKGNRKKDNGRPPRLLLGHIREFIIKHFPVCYEPMLEADDIIGIKATSDDVVCTIDKDLRQIEGLHYNMDHPDRGVEHQTIPDAVRLHYMQMLTGDAVDFYKGCPGIGPVKAAAALADAEAVFKADKDAGEGADSIHWYYWQQVVALFENKGLTERDALVQARVSRILREGEYDWNTKEVKLWRPPVE